MSSLVNPVRTGRWEAWSVVGLLVLGPWLVVGAFLPSIWHALDDLVVTTSSNGDDDHKAADWDEVLPAYFTLCIVGLQAFLMIPILCHAVEHVLVLACSSYVVTPSRVEAVSHGPATIASYYTYRYHYQVPTSTSTFYKMVVPNTWEASSIRNATDSLLMTDRLHVHPIYPQLARSDSEMSRCLLMFQVFVGFFGNACLLVLTVLSGHLLWRGGQSLVLAVPCGVGSVSAGWTLAWCYQTWATTNRGWQSSYSSSVSSDYYVSWQQVQLLWVVLLGRREEGGSSSSGGVGGSSNNNHEPFDGVTDYIPAASA